MDRVSQPTNKAIVTVPQSEIQSLRDEVRSLAAELTPTGHEEEYTKQQQYCRKLV